MKSFREVQAELNATMSDEERQEYERGYEETGHRIDLAQLFYDARMQAGLSQSELARRMGTTQPVIARYEAAGSSPRVEVVERLAKATGKKLRMELEPA